MIAVIKGYLKQKCYVNANILFPCHHKKSTTLLGNEVTFYGNLYKFPQLICLHFMYISYV